MPGYNDLATTNPELAAEWHPTKNGMLTPHDVTAGSNKKVWWLGACGHAWKASMNYRKQYKVVCPKCDTERIAKGYAHDDWPDNLCLQIKSFFKDAENFTGRKIIESLYRMPEKRRDILIRRYKKHKTITKIAEEKGCTKQAVWSALRNAEKNLVCILKQINS